MIADHTTPAPSNPSAGVPVASGSGPNGHITTPSGNTRNESRRIQELIERAESLADPEARELVQECLRSLLALYGDGWARVLQLIKNAGIEGQKVKSALLDDKLIRSLLLIHGLHPQDLKTRLLAALTKIRPYLESHGGSIELARLENDVATLRLQGTCKSCPSSAVTLELAVRQSIEDSCPDLLGFEVESVAPEMAVTAPGPCLATTNGA